MCDRCGRMKLELKRVKGSFNLSQISFFHFQEQRNDFFQLASDSINEYYSSINPP